MSRRCPALPSGPYENNDLRFSQGVKFGGFVGLRRNS